MALSTVSHYELLSKIGEGGMGVVFRAHDTILNRTVALKFLPDDIAATEVEKARLIQEARAAARLNHPNVCIIHGIEQEGDRRFIVMEHVDGTTLRQEILRRERKAPLPLADALSYALQIAEALEEAHRLGIIHRDVKSDNIMVNGRNQIKVMDFGLARLKGSVRLTRASHMVGTVGYMAPEQIQGGEIDHRADLFSFGVVLYEMLTGHMPFRGDNEAAIVYSILQREPEPIEAYRSDLPPELITLIQRALRKNPGDRCQSASEIIAALHPIARSVIPPSRIRVPLRRVPGPSRPATWSASGVVSRIRSLSVVQKGVSLAALAGAAAMVWILTGTRPPFLSQADYLVVADFENRTGDSVFNHSLTEALRVKLRESAQFNVLSPDRVASAMELLRLPTAGPLDDRSAVSVARREGARAVVAGNIARLGSAYVLTAAVIDATTGTTLELPREEVPRIEDVLVAMDRLSSKVRRNLGEEMDQISKANAPLPQATTSSLQALELYSRGDILALDGKYREAAMLNQEAVKLDSEFVMAISELSYDYRKIGSDSLAAAYHARVLPLIHRVTERERLEMLVTYYGPSFEMDYQKAREVIQQITARYPNDPYAFAQLGHISMFAGDSRAALEANTRAVMLYPEYEKVCSYNSGYALVLEGKPREGMIYLRKAKALRPAYAGIDASIASTHWMNGDMDSADTVLRRSLETAEGYQKNVIRVVLSSLEYFRGHLSAARSICLAGVSECRAMKKPADESWFHYLQGEFAAAGGQRSEFRAEMKSAVALSRSPFYDLALAGISYAREGMKGEAENVIARLQSVRSYDPLFIKYRPSFVRVIQGEIALQDRDHASARRHFGAVQKVEAGDPFYLVARGGLVECAAASSDSSAETLMASLASLRGEIMLGSLTSIRRTGPWTRWLWPELELTVGRQYAGRGLNAEAIAHLQVALRCWADAVQSDRGAIDARTLLLRLSGGK